MSHFYQFFVDILTITGEEQPRNCISGDELLHHNTNMTTDWSIDWRDSVMFVNSCEVFVCIEYMQDAYQQAERLMLVRKAAAAASSDSSDQLTAASTTLAKLSPPTKHTGRVVTIYTVSQTNCANLFFAPWLSNVNRFQQKFAALFMKKPFTKHFPECPLHLKYVPALPWEIWSVRLSCQHSN